MAMTPTSTTILIRRVTTRSDPARNSSVLAAGGQRSISDITTQVGNMVTPNPHAYTSTRWRGWVGSAYYKAGDTWTQVDGLFGTPFTYSSYFLPVDAAAYNVAIGRMYDALRGSVDLSVDLVQWRKTLQMISLYRRLVSSIAYSAKRLVPQIDNIDRLRKDLTNVKRGSKRAKRLGRELNGALNTLAVARLEYVYGWSPTMSTLHDIAKGAILTDEPGLLKVEGNGSTKSRKEFTSYPIHSGVPSVFISSVSTRERIVCYFNPRPNTLDALSKISSLNPVSILYEATPFSFVLDWAIDISGWLRTYETAFVHQNEFVKGFHTTVTRWDVDARTNGVWFQYPNAPDVAFNRYNLQGTAVKVQFNRRVLASAPFPRAPVKNFKFGLDRQLNAIALAKVTLLKADNRLGKWRR